MTGIDIAIEIYHLLNTPDVTSVARVWQHNRPQNSDLTDVVISVPQYNYNQFVSGYVDINIFTPNIKVTIEGKDDSTFPNMAVLKPVTDLVVSKIENTGNYNLDVRVVGIPTRDSDGNWYTNTRIGFESINPGVSHLVELWELSGVPDGYGGSVVTRSLEWTGYAVQENIGNGTQLNLNDSGRYEFNMRCDWLIPNHVEVEKNWQLLTDFEVYVINGIVPDGNSFRLSCVRKDFNDDY